MQAGDVAALRWRHALQGARFAFPDLADARYVKVEVAERDGVVAGAFVVHATLEVYLLGADALTARAAVRQAPVWRQELRGMGADEAHAFVPADLAVGMVPLLRRAGMRPSNGAYLPYYCEL